LLTFSIIVAAFLISDLPVSHQQYLPKEVRLHLHSLVLKLLAREKKK